MSEPQLPREVKRRLMESLTRGELVEPFEHARLATPYAYWLVSGPQPSRPELERFGEWVLAQARGTRILIGETAEDEVTS